MRIGIIGLGTVGNAMKNGFEEWHDIFIHDPKLGTEISDIIENTEVAYISVPTPCEIDTGKCDTSLLEGVLEELPAGYSVVIKSTIVPGTTERLIGQFPGIRIANCPEFMREVSSEEDFLNQEILVVGSEDKEFAREIFEHHRIAGVVEEGGFFRVTPTQAELVKYAKNSFFAMKVIFANQFHDYCAALGEDWKGVREVITHPQRQIIGPTHLEAMIGSRRGFGGKCIPKDLKALYAELSEMGIAYEIFGSIMEDNSRLRENEI
jgi:UDPglucose 6-dehydrogenase